MTFFAHGYLNQPKVKVTISDVTGDVTIFSAGWADVFIATIAARSVHNNRFQFSSSF